MYRTQYNLFLKKAVVQKTSMQEWTPRSTILEESHPNTILRHIIPYNLWFRIFSEKKSDFSTTMQKIRQICGAIFGKKAKIRK